MRVPAHTHEHSVVRFMYVQLHRVTLLTLLHTVRCIPIYRPHTHTRTYRHDFHVRIPLFVPSFLVDARKKKTTTVYLLYSLYTQSFLRDRLRTQSIIPISTCFPLPLLSCLVYAPRHFWAVMEFGIILCHKKPPSPTTLRVRVRNDSVLRVNILLIRANC